jgi:transcriptional regulator with XRE-family HTH domain
MSRARATGSPLDEASFWTTGKRGLDVMHEVNGLRAARTAAGWSQARLVAAMRASAGRFGIALPGDDSLKTNIKRWENGRVTPGLPYRRLFQFIYGMTADQLGFPPLDEQTLQQVNVNPTRLSGEALEYYGLLLNEHVRSDNLLGPRYALDLVRQQVTSLTMAAREARGRDRLAVLRMASRYSEFYGWLLQDAGRCDDATISTDRARDFAAELGDTSLSAYLMMRRSNIATDNGDPALAAGLANAALAADRAGVSLKVRALLLRQKANAHASLGESGACSSALSEAFEIAGSAQLETTDLAEYCTTAYVAMEAGTCWVTLGDTVRALAAFSHSPTSGWDPALRRDQGLSLARRATALAGAGDVVAACQTAHEAIAIVTITRSSRILKELSRLPRQLKHQAHDPHVAVLRRAIASLTAVA